MEPIQNIASQSITVSVLYVNMFVYSVNIVIIDSNLHSYAVSILFDT